MAVRTKATARRNTPARKQAARKIAPRSRDAIALLRADHALVLGLFEQFEKARSSDRKQTLADRICQELRIHTRIEEEILYPAARVALDDEDMLDEAEVEHAGAKDLIAQIERGKAGEDLWDAKVKVLGEYIDHHVKEEHRDMFPELRKAKLDLREIGARLEARKQELKSGTAPRAKTASGLTGSRPKGEATVEEEGFIASLAKEIGLKRA